MSISISNAEVFKMPFRPTTFWVDLLALTKPRITLMTVIVGIGSMALSATPISFGKMVLSLLGIALLVSGSSALNMYLERDIDILMARTRNRPLPSGRMQPEVALLAGLFLSLLAVPVLWWGSNGLTTLLGIFSLITYVLIYTPMKRVSCYALVVGAVPGAMPALMGYTAASGIVDLVGLSLFGILFVWQLPHFIAITIYRAQEYTYAGFPVVAKVFGLMKARLMVVVTTLMLVGLSLLAYLGGLGGYVYVYACLLLGIWFGYVALKGFWEADLVPWSKRVFMVSIGYECLLFAALAVDVMIRRITW